MEFAIKDNQHSILLNPGKYLNASLAKLMKHALTPQYAHPSANETNIPKTETNK